MKDGSVVDNSVVKKKTFEASLLDRFNPFADHVPNFENEPHQEPTPTPA